VLAAPAGALPQGGGLPIVGDHASTCDGVPVTMVIPANATSFWIIQSDNNQLIPEGHYLVKTVTVTFQRVPTTYDFGTKTAFGNTINCVGTFGDYGINSTDVLVK
jgi:hypothetical protein